MSGEAPFLAPSLDSGGALNRGASNGASPWLGVPLRGFFLVLVECLVDVCLSIVVMLGVCGGGSGFVLSSFPSLPLYVYVYLRGVDSIIHEDLFTLFVSKWSYRTIGNYAFRFLERNLHGQRHP